MSPAINDPGTAINCIDYLTELFSLRMQQHDNTVIMQNEKAVVGVAIITFNKLTYNVMASLRTYCKHDPIMVQKLIWMLCYLQKQPAAEGSFLTTIKEQTEILLEQAKGSLDSKTDIATITKMFGSINN